MRCLQVLRDFVIHSLGGATSDEFLEIGPLAESDVKFWRDKAYAQMDFIDDLMREIHILSFKRA